jgi:hypothetical protein
MSRADASWSFWGEGLDATWELLREKLAAAGPPAEGWRALAQIGRPVEPFAVSDLLAPIVGVAGVLLGLLLAGVAVVALGALLASLLALGLLLTRVFGISVEIDPAAPR